jgi:hypothetical protein
MIVMKSKLLFIVFITTFLLSCTKDRTNTKPASLEIPTSLIAKWNWDFSTGGYAGITYTPVSTGEARRIEFTADYNFKYYVNDILKSENKFEILKLISVNNHDSTLMVIMMKNSWPTQSFSFRTSDTLILTEGGYDGFEHHYTRIK